LAWLRNPFGIIGLCSCPETLRLGLQNDSFNFIETQVIGCSVIQLRSPRRFMGGDLLSLLDCAAIFQVGRNVGCPKGVATDGVGETGGYRATFYHCKYATTI
jgi:hypothetical protein